MGHIETPTPAMDPFAVETRRDSFYITGDKNFTWWRWREDAKSFERHTTAHDKIPSEVDDDIEVCDTDVKPDGKGWTCGPVRRKRSLIAYPVDKTSEGTLEMRYSLMRPFFESMGLVQEKLRRKGDIDQTYVEEVAANVLAHFFADQGLLAHPGEISTLVAAWYAEYRERFTAPTEDDDA